MTVPQYIQFSTEIWGILFCAAAAVTVFIKRSIDKKGTASLMSLLLDSALILLCDSAARLCDGRSGSAPLHTAKISYFLAFFFAFLAMPLSAEYLTHTVRKHAADIGNGWKKAEWLMFAVSSAALTANVFYPYIYTFDGDGAYRRLSFGLLPFAAIFIGLAIEFVFVLGSVKHLYTFEKTAVVIGLALPLPALFLEIFDYGISFTFLAITLTSLILFISYEVSCQNYAAEKEKALAEERIRLFNSQIRPHFMFNCLTVIKRLCRLSPELVPETIDEFSRYLRCCTDMMNTNDSIPVTRELDLVRHYVYMQTKRFDDAIFYEFDIRDDEFNVPPFAVQTCVENAIEHGLRMRKIEKATVAVRTYSTPKAHIVEIEDNGVGFDADKLKHDGKTEHVGIKNTRERLLLMCGGTLTIDSKADRGTKVTVTIPKKPTGISRSKTDHENSDRR